MGEGQFLGKKASYIYKSDNDTEYLIVLDKSNGDLTALGLTAATTANAGLPNLPSNFEKRLVYWEGILDNEVKRKALTCNREAEVYADTAKTLTVDGVAGRITGRRGERVTFPNLPAASSD